MTSPNITDVDRLVLKAIVASPERTLFGQKKLQKVLFIAHHPGAFDVETKRPLRSLRFKIYKFGPFTSELYQSIERLQAAGLVEREERDVSRATREPTFPGSEDESAPPHRIVVFTARDGAEEELTGADEVDLALVAKVIKRWGWLTSDQMEELVCDRTGLTPDLKTRYQNMEWESFARHAKDESDPARPTISDAYWRAEQEFLKERGALLEKYGSGKFAAYLDGARVAIADDDGLLYDQVERERGRAPDFVGFISESGRRVLDAFAC